MNRWALRQLRRFSSRRFVYLGCRVDVWVRLADAAEKFLLQQTIRRFFNV